MKKLPASILSFALAVLSLEAAPVLSSSMSLSETDNAYTVKIGVAEKTPVNVRLAGRVLLLETVTGDKAPRYDQNLQLPAAVPDAPLGIQRDSGELVITVPKGGPAPSSAALPDPFRDAFSRLDDFDAMRDDMLKQAAALMNQFNQTAKSPTRGTSGMDMLQSLLSQSGLASVIGSGAGGFELREEADRYVLVSKIPEAQAKNVSVNVDNDRFVTITTKQDKSSQTGGLSAFSASSSTQSITLPGPVKVERMTMDYKNGQVEVTLPKA
jgi:HSP20 family molecular chaperone IbpA